MASSTRSQQELAESDAGALAAATRASALEAGGSAARSHVEKIARVLSFRSLLVAALLRFLESAALGSRALKSELGKVCLEPVIRAFVVAGSDHFTPLAQAVALRFVRGVCSHNTAAQVHASEVLSDALESQEQGPRGFSAALLRQQALTADLITVVVRGPSRGTDWMYMSPKISILSSQKALAITPEKRARRAAWLHGLVGASGTTDLAVPSNKAGTAGTDSSESAKGAASGAGGPAEAEGDAGNAATQDALQQAVEQAADEQLALLLQGSQGDESGALAGEEKELLPAEDSPTALYLSVKAIQGFDAAYQKKSQAIDKTYPGISPSIKQRVALYGMHDACTKEDTPNELRKPFVLSHRSLGAV